MRATVRRVAFNAIKSNETSSTSCALHIIKTRVIENCSIRGNEIVTLSIRKSAR